MQTMKADGWIFLSALCFICVSSNEEEHYDCKRHTLIAPPGSSVLLPCHFANSSLDWVSWTYTPLGEDPWEYAEELVRLTSEGRVKFLDPRHGRVKVFPNQGSQGNFSIRIDELDNSELGYTDLGWYRCMQGHDCLQLLLVSEIGVLSEEMRLLIYICAGVAAFILLSVAGYCCMKCTLCCNKRTQDNTNNTEGAGTEGASVPPEEPGRVAVDQQQRGAGDDQLVYENDDQDPSHQQHDNLRNYCNPIGVLPYPDPDRTQPTQSTSGIYPNVNQFERPQSLRTKQRFHRELFSRLRNASLSRHYYVNQSDLKKQQATSSQAENHRKAGLGKKKKKKAEQNGEYKNPIYNRSTDQLNHL